MKLYNVSCFDVYVVDAFKEGYVFNDATRIPVGSLGYFFVFENISLLFPSCKTNYQDWNAAFFDKRKEGQVVLFFGVDDKHINWFDFVITGQDGFRLEGVGRPATAERFYRGFDILGMWLSQSRVRSFGLAPASVVATQVFIDAFQEYKKICSWAEMEINVDMSTDFDRYIQVDVPSTRFMYSLRDSARDGDKGGFFAWIDRPCSENRKKVRFNFKSMEKLKKQRPKFTFEYTYDGQEIEKAFSNNGHMSDGAIPVLSFHIDSRNSNSFLANKREYELYTFDIKKKKIIRRVKTLVNEKEKDVLKSFYERMWKPDYRVKGVMNVSFDWLGRYVSNLERTGFRRRVYVLVPGCSDLRLGDKIKMILPTGYTPSEVIEALSGEWVIGSLTHMLSVPDGHYLIKVGLIGEEFNYMK